MAIDMERLKKLLLVVLSSDQAGEVMAASAAIAKLLKKDAKDIHWLVASVAGQKQTKPAASPPPQNAPSWAVKLAYCEDRYDYLTPRQQEFIGSLCEQRAERPGWQPSFAQKAWLNDIYSKH